mmetsp:Transcript_23987/g.51045  ORF Transcript_23987/g.51045 Transcript_23987/m.51045 type:complete len:96 (+) Transcript_23987:120-407(+)
MDLVPPKASTPVGGTSRRANRPLDKYDDVVGHHGADGPLNKHDSVIGHHSMDVSYNVGVYFCSVVECCDSRGTDSCKQRLWKRPSIIGDWKERRQ